MQETRREGDEVGGEEEEKRRRFCCMTFTKTWRAGGGGISRSTIDSSLEVLKGILTAWGGGDREGGRAQREKTSFILIRSVTSGGSWRVELSPSRQVE